MRFLLLLLLPGLALAAPLEYWAVGESVEDVISAANFAASMKGSVGVTFSGRTAEQVDEALTTVSLNDVVMVEFSGDEATITAGLHPEFDSVVANARAYLEREGFDVTVSQPETRRPPRLGL